jgi:hypothetical protein
MAFAEIKSATANLINENTELKQRVKELTDNPITLKDGVWYDRRGNVFCPACYANDPPLYAALRVEQGTDEHGDTWIKRACTKCEKRFDDGRVPDLNSILVS